MASVKFYRGLKAKYNATTHKDSLYFATDTKEILLNGNSYSGTTATAVVEKYIGDGKAIEVDASPDASGNKKVSLKLHPKEGNVLTATENGAFASLKIRQVKLGGEPDLLYRYELVMVDAGGVETPLKGDYINVPTDKHLSQVVLGSMPTGQPDEGAEALIFTFMNGDNEVQKSYVSLASLISENDIKGGLDIDGEHKLYIKINDSESDKGSDGAPYLSVSEQGVRIYGINKELDKIREHLEWHEAD